MLAGGCEGDYRVGTRVLWVWYRGEKKIETLKKKKHLAYSNIWLTHTNHLSSLPATPVTNNERFLIYSFLCDLLYFCFVCNSISLMSTGSVSTCMAPRVFMNYALSSDPYNRKRMTLALCIYELIYCIITFMSVSINCCFSAHAPPTLP